MIGYAAGFVDPITGEGLYYAFRSAELLAEALIADRPEQYQKQVNERERVRELGQHRREDCRNAKDNFQFERTVRYRQE